MPTPPMTGPDGGIALSLLRELLDLDGEGREALIRERCAGDDGLRTRVLALLASDACPDTALDAPLTIEQSGHDEPVDVLPGSLLGPFRVLERIGRGGMGTVYRAVREGGDFAQEVAIKIIRRGLDSDDILARFLRERRILARLTHPNLARLVDGGPGPDGRPWFAMEFIRGASLTDWCDQRHLALPRRIGLFLEACAAVQHAHERLVVHRDLKPANILVDDSGHVRLLDFGIAKLVGGDDQADSAATLVHGPLLFTPEYAAPEQLAGGEIGVATDIHALGVILFELISGTLPYPGGRSGKARASAGDAASTPVRLAGAVTRVDADDDGSSTGDRLARRSTSLHGYRQSVRGDLERIVATAMAREPSRRYATVQALADDLSRYLRGEPVTVTGDDWRYRLGKFVGRHRWQVALAGLAVASLAVGVAGVLWQANQTARAAERALAASERAAVVKDFLASLLSAANPFVNPGQTPTVRDLLEQAGKRIDDEFANQPSLAAELHGLVGGSYRGLGEMASAARHLEKAIDLVDRVDLPPRQRADIRSEYAHALIGGNRSEQALAVAQQALADLDGIADAAPSRARALSVQATAHMLLGRPEQGLAAQRDAVDIVCVDGRAPDQDCVGALIELKYFHEGIGDEAAALTVAERAWHAAEALHGERPHPQRVMAAGAYGDALAWAGRAGEAIDVLEPTVLLARAIYGEENFRHARALEWLATAYTQAGRSSEALTLAERTLAIGNSSAPGNPRTPVWLHRIVSLLLDLRRPDEAAGALAAYATALPSTLPGPVREAMDLLDLRVALALDPRSEQVRNRLQSLQQAFADSGSGYLDPARLLAVRAALDAADPATASALLAQAQDAGSSGDASATWLHLDAWRLRLQGAPARAQAQAALGLKRVATLGQQGSPLAAELHTELGRSQCLAGDRASGRDNLDAAARIWGAHAAGHGAHASVADARRDCGP